MIATILRNDRLVRCHDYKTLAFISNDSKPVYCLHMHAFDDLNPIFNMTSVLKKCVVFFIFKLLMYVFEIDNNIENSSSHCQT